MSYEKDSDGNELGTLGKITAGILLLFVTGLSAYLIVGLWPDRIPLPTEKVQAYYQFKLFNVRLVKITDRMADSLGDLQVLNSLDRDTNGRDCVQDSIKIKSAPSTKVSALLKIKIKAQRQLDSLQKGAAGVKDKDTTKIKEAKQELAKASLAEKKEWQHLIDSVHKAKEGYKVLSRYKHSFDELIHLNTLQLMLVALGGFLGNIIYIGTSFTAFLGSGQFKQSWLLWYLVKPLTASGLAIAIYFLLCGGFLTLNNSSNSINLNAIMGLAILTGLFTDKATLKLGEIFEVVFKSNKDNRSDQLVGPPKVTAITPSELIRKSENKINVTGEGFQIGKIKLFIDDVELETEIKTNLITAKYIPGDDPVGKSKIRLTVKSDKGALVAEKDITLKDPSGN